jgi:hypothetical protein
VILLVTMLAPARRRLGERAAEQEAIMRVAHFVTAIVVGCTALLISAGPGLAAQPSPEETGRVLKLPQTPDDHLVLAKGYDEKAAAWRKEAAFHREMAAAYKRSHPDFKGIRNPEAVTMEKHCAKIAKDADRLAEDAEDTAKYHRLRAKELQGG